MEVKTTTEYLKCILTDDEFREYSSTLARKYSDIQELESQKKAITSDFASRINSATEETSRLARIIQNKCEYRNVDCEILYNYDKGIVTVIRLDTGEEVKSRAMTSDERQKKMFEEEKETV